MGEGLTGPFGGRWLRRCCTLTENVVPPVVGSLGADVVAALPKRGEIARHGGNRYPQEFRHFRCGMTAFAHEPEYGFEAALDIK